MASTFDTLFATYGAPPMKAFFGESVTYTPLGASPQTLTAIPGHAHTPEFDQNDLKSLWPIREFDFARADVTPANGATITLGGEAWQIDGLAERSGSMVRVKTILAAANWALIHTCAISRDGGATEDSLNRPVASFASVATGVACRLIEEGKRTLTRDLEIVIEFPFLLVGPGANIAIGDRISSITRGDSSAYTGTFTVVSLHDPWGENHHRQAKLERVSGA